MEQWKEEDLHALVQIGSEQLFFDYFSAKANAIGFEYCSFGLRLPVPIANPKTVVHQNYPKDWWERYQKNNYLRIDPTVRQGLTSNTLILWSAETFSSAPEMWEDANAHGLRHGLAQPARDSQGTFGMLSLSRCEQHLDKKELIANTPRVQHMIQMLLVGMTRLVVPKMLPESLSHLTPREKEVLRWTADGKTSYEIGRILSISISAVNFHINNAVAKLDTSNKTQAVVKAALLGLLN